MDGAHFMNRESIPLFSCFCIGDFAFFIVEHPRSLYRITCIFWSFPLYSAQYDISLFLLCHKIGNRGFGVFFRKHKNNLFSCSKPPGRYGSFWVICVYSFISHYLTTWATLSPLFIYFYFSHSFILPSCPICLVGHPGLYRIGYTGSPCWPAVKLN